MGKILNICGVFSLFAVLFLLGLGVVLYNDYEFVEVDNRQEGGKTCFWAAGIYGLVLILVFVGKKIRKSKPEYKEISCN